MVAQTRLIVTSILPVFLNTELIKPYKLILIVTEAFLSPNFHSFSLNSMILQTSMALVQTSTYTN